MRYQTWYMGCGLFATTLAQSMSLSLESNRLAPVDCAPQLHFCSDSNWRGCSAPITSSSRCVSTDRLNDVASIAIGLGVCCRFYYDNKCNTPYTGWSGKEVWFPGMSHVDSAFIEQVGSYMCKNGTLSTDCPGAGPANISASESGSYPTTSQVYTLSAYL